MQATPHVADRKKVSAKTEQLEWEIDSTEWDEKDANWLAETGNVLRLAFMAPITTVELVTRSMAPSEYEEKAIPPTENEAIEWGSSKEWLEESSHVFIKAFGKVHARF